MTGRDDLEPLLAGWFEEEARASADSGTLDRVLDRTRHRTPRPALIAGIGSHAVTHLPAGTSVRWRTAAIALMAVALVAGSLVVGANILRPPVTTDRLGDLAYSKDGGLFLAASDGSSPVPIADGVLALGTACFRERTPTSIWAPDGRHLAYRDEDMTTVSIADPTGRVVASVPGYGWNVAWSPDATRIATFVQAYETMGVYGVDGTLDALLRLPPGVRVRGDYDPTWSPDGRSLLIPAADADDSRSRMWEVPIDGRVPTPVPDDDPRSRRVRATSPDGARFAYVHGSRVRIYDASGDPQVVRLPAPSVVGFPLWSPSGRWVVMAVMTRDDLTLERGSDLRLVDAGTTDVTTLISRGDGNVMAPIRFSPDGERLLYSNEAADDSTSLWSIRVDGTDARLLVGGTSCGDWRSVPSGS